MAKCNWCGKSGFFLDVTKHGFCPVCDAKLRKQIKSQLEAIEVAVKELNPSVYSGDCGIALQRLEYMIKSIGALEVIRPRVPFFKSSTAPASQTFAAYQRAFFLKQEAMKEAALLSTEERAAPVVPPVRPPQGLANKVVAQMAKNTGLQGAATGNSVLNQALATVPHYDIAIVSGAKILRSTRHCSDVDVQFSLLRSNSRLSKFSSFVAIDTETTGFSANSGRILQVSAIRFEDFHPVSNFTTMVNPLIAIPPQASAVNGIYADDVKDSPTFPEIAESLNGFIQDLPLVGHNLSFDLKFLHKCGLDFLMKDRLYFDTLKLSKIIDPDADDHKLDTLLMWHGLFRNNAHHSDIDAFCTGLLFLEYVADKVDFDARQYPNLA